MLNIFLQSRKTVISLGTSLFVSVLFLSLQALAQDKYAAADAIEIEEVISVGTRSKPRTATDSPVPVDSFNTEQLQNQGTSDMNVALSNLIPSFNVAEQSTADGSAFIRPVTLRGLAPDQTLVLLNGKRRHRSALVNLSNGAGSLALGSQGPDTANIPSIAIKNAEVLRDGAAAQYGSDAIAGVINFVLKDSDEGLEVVTQYGEYYEGEAEYKIAANYGMPLGGNGFMSLSGEFAAADPTSRGDQRPDAQALIDGGNNAVASPAQRWGKTDNESTRLFWNGGVTYSEKADLYFFGNYSQTEVESGFFYRNPNTNSAFSDVPFDPNDVVGGGIFNFRDSFYPGGFTPQFGGEVFDFSQVIGVRGDLDNGVNYDVSASFGSNKIEYSIKNTINPSMGPNSPTAFKPGELKQKEQNLNIDLGYEISSNMHLAGGLEYREESYKISAGDPASYEIGPWAVIVDSGSNPVINPATGNPFAGLPVGSNGFPGFSPDQAGTFKRDNYAAYVDFEMEPNDQLLINLAARFEDFSDFGTTTNGKLALRYFVSETLNLRAAMGTGFKAPTPGQANTTNVATRLFPPSTELVAVGILPPTDPIAQFFGGEELDPETSVNYSAGLVLMPTTDLTLSIDFYRIEIDDRISLSGSIPIGPAEVAALIAAGLDRASDFGRIQFYTNGFDTVTRGADVVATYSLEGDASNTTFNLAYAYNDNRVTRAAPGIITRDRELELEDALPEHRINLSAVHQMGEWSIMGRIKYFSEVLEADASDPALDELAGSEILVDAEVTYNFDERFSLSLGAHNLFDNYPDKNDRLSGAGLPYFRQSPVGWQGGQWYLRLRTMF